VSGGTGGAAVVAGLAYFAIVFAAGFVLGAIRTLILVPRVGPVAAVLIELPVMLAIAWFACGWAVQHFSVPPEFTTRLVVGVVAFVLLMLAELALSVVAFRGTVAGFFTGLKRPEGSLGLAGQILFAAMPLIRIWR
jgi:hypothetical protein